MPLELWFSFVAAAMLMCLTPGPTTIFIMGQALNQGRGAVLPLLAGTMTADIIAMSLSFVGVGAILATSATLFGLLKWVGAAYLVYLGIKAWRAEPQLPSMGEGGDGQAINSSIESSIDRGALYRRALLITVLNPKGIIFFMAFFPLFMDPAQPALPQMLALMIGFEIASIVSVCCYGLGSGLLRSRIHSLVFQRRFNRTSGAMLIGAGAFTAALQR